MLTALVPDLLGCAHSRPAGLQPQQRHRRDARAGGVRQSRDLLHARAGLSGRDVDRSGAHRRRSREGRLRPQRDGRRLGAPVDRSIRAGRATLRPPTGSASIEQQLGLDRPAGFEAHWMRAATAAGPDRPALAIGRTAATHRRMPAKPPPPCPPPSTRRTSTWSAPIRRTRGSPSASPGSITPAVRSRPR